MYKYAHGGDIYDEQGHKNDGIIDFSANINPLGIPEAAVEAAKNSILRANIYPDSNCRLLGAKIGEFENVDKKNIICSNGASDILFRLVYAAKPKKILVAAPSFLDYERAGKAAGAEVVYYTLKKENNFNVRKDIIDAIAAASPDIVFICNPNNPTGNLTDFETMEEIAAACEPKNALLLADECFLDFVCGAHGYSAKPLIERHKNIVILKAFTKIFAMPGLRLGYAICKNTELMDRMRFCGADWAVSNAAQQTGIAALKDGERYIADTVAYLQKERAYIAKELENIGFAIYPSYANFIFFHCPWDIDLCAELRKKGIVIRDCANFKGLEPGYCRTAVLAKEKNKLLIEALKGVRRLWQNR